MNGVKQTSSMVAESTSNSAAKSVSESLPCIEEFWGVEPCGSHLVHNKIGTQEFYEQFRKLRYQTEWHIPLLVPFGEGTDKDVLEIGCGNGADGTLFAEAGARYTGVDLTEAAVQSTKAHFQSRGLSGRFQRENAESLSFPDQSFDLVYSHGVLHHTSNPTKAFSEVYRVLRPGGKAILMLYHKHSLNYYIRIMAYMRVRVLLRIASRVGRFSRDRSRLSAGAFTSIRGNENPVVWDAHYANFLRNGWSYLLARNFIHHATDGPDCPYAYVYTKSSVRKQFRAFSAVQTKCAHLPLRKYLAWVPFSVERNLSAMTGWYLFVYATK